MSECSISEQFEESELEISKCETILVHHNTTSDWLIKGDVTEHVFSKKKTRNVEFLARGSKCEWHLHDGNPGISQALSVKVAQKRELLAGVIRFIWNICHYESHLPEISQRSQTSI